MKKIILISAACLFLTGCSSETNEQKNDRIISETKKCEEAGLKAEAMRNGMTWETNSVVCSPK